MYCKLDQCDVSSSCWTIVRKHRLFKTCNLTCGTNWVTR